MSFLSVLKHVGRDLETVLGVIGQVELDAVPIVTALDPPMGGLLAAVAASTSLAEKLIVGEKRGAEKKAAVTGFLTPALPGVPPAAISQLIDSFVGVMNALTEAQRQAVVKKVSVVLAAV